MKAQEIPRQGHFDNVDRQTGKLKKTVNEGLARDSDTDSFE